MDRECVKKHKDVFESWLNGKEIEWTDGIDPWKTCPSNPEWKRNHQYRIKPEVAHYANGCNGPWGKNETVTIDRSKVTCPDCLAKMLPEWIKVGAKCFYDFGPTGIKLVKIDKILENGRVSFLGEKEKCGGVAHYSSLSPAVLRPPTYETLLPFAPLALCVKGCKKIWTVTFMDESAVYFSDGRFCYFKDLHKTYTYTDGSEIGEWVKDSRSQEIAEQG